MSKLKSKEELQSELTSLKETHKNVYTIEALNEDGEIVATIFLKKADRLVHASVGKLAQGNDPLKAVEACLKACYIGGDSLSLVLENEDALFSCEGAVVELLTKRTATLKKN